MPPLSKFERFLRSARRRGVATPPPPPTGWNALQKRLAEAGASHVTPAVAVSTWSPGRWITLATVVLLLAGGLLWWWSPTTEFKHDKQDIPAVKQATLPIKEVPLQPASADSAFAMGNVRMKAMPMAEANTPQRNDSQRTDQDKKVIITAASRNETLRSSNTAAVRVDQTSEMRSDTNTCLRPIMMTVLSDSGVLISPLRRDLIRREAAATVRTPLVRDKIMVALPAPIIRVVPTEGPLDKLPPVEGEKIVFGFTGKPKARAEWQAFAAYNSIFSYYPYGFGSSIYSRSGGGSSRNFVLPSGETIGAAFSGSQGFSSAKANSFYVRAGVSRQMRDGFNLTAELGAYKGYSRRRNNNYDQIGPDEIRLDYDLKEFMVSYSLGMQFTFLKRHRFRPYLGVQALGFLYYNGRSESTFFDGQTQTAGLDQRFETRQYFPAVLDYALIAGFQYKFTQGFSAGISLFANSGFDYFLEAPVGIEVRYTLK